MDELGRVIKCCFAQPAIALGKIERNCEVKVMFLVLWKLGWDPVAQLLLGFQVDKEAVGEGAYMSGEPHVVVRDAKGIVLVGDAKHWDADLDKHFAQIRKYQKALRVPRAFLTNGHRWVVIGEEGKEILLDKDFQYVDDMLSVLKHWIGPTAVDYPGVLAYEGAIEKGLSLRKEAGPVDLSAKWNPGNYPDATARKFLRMLHQLVDENADLLRREAKKNLFIRCRGGKLIEYSPETNTIAATKKDHREKLHVPEALSKEYHRIVEGAHRVVADPERILLVLRRIVKALRNNGFLGAERRTGG